MSQFLTFLSRSKFGLAITTILIVTVGILPVLVNTGGYYLYYGDFTAQQIPFIYEVKRMLSSGMPLWTWNLYFGENFIGSQSFYTLTSPFV